MRSDGPAAVIIGGGYSGTMVAAELARRGVPSVLVNGSGREGKGTAFSTPEAAHLLNVVAGRMGAWADKPEDFAEAVAEEGYEPHDYVPRRRYGEYLSNILNEARATGLAKPDALDLGLEVDANSRIAGSDNAWAIGPLTKGNTGRSSRCLISGGRSRRSLTTSPRN